MKFDNYVIELARKILAADQRKYASLFLELSQYIESIIDGKDAITALRTIWKKNLLPIMLLEMKRDFTNFEPRSWTDGFRIVHTVYDVLTRVVPSASTDESALRTQLIPGFIDSVLCFCRQMQSNFNESLNPDYRGPLTSRQLLAEIRAVLELIESFITRFPERVSTVIESVWFLQVFITDRHETSALMAEWLTKLVKMQPSVLKTISKSTVKGIGNVLNTIFDEIVYHIATNTDATLVEMDIRCLLTLLESDPSTRTTLQLRYKGLKLLVMKWFLAPNEITKIGFSSSFVNDLRQIVKQLESSVVYHTDASTHLWAVLKIQAWWRSVAVRQKLLKTNRAFGKFQRSYRSRKLREKKEQSNLRIRKELEHQILITRQQKFRNKLEAEVLLLETLPAPIVFRHFEKTRQESATKIQAVWRGHRERAQLIARQQLYRKTRAVRVIQKYARAWFSRRDLAANNSNLNREQPELEYWNIPGLTVERKAELVKMHNRWMMTHKHEFKGLGEDEQLDLHHRSQQLYRHHLHALKSSRRKDAQRELTLARLEADSKLLLSAPTLTEAIEGSASTSDIKFRLDNFHCKIRPIANRAAQLHHARVNVIKQPWWKQLHIEEPVDLEADDDLLAEPVDLDQYMIMRNRLEFLKEADMAALAQ